MRKVVLLILCVLLSGCVTTSAVTPKLSLGMTKQEVLAACGNPRQSGAIQTQDGRILESFEYKESPLLEPASKDLSITTYVYFEDGKVIYYGGNPTMPTEPTTPKAE